METLEGLRRKIHVAEDLQSVVTTMKSLAAVNIRQYEEATRALATYSRTIELGFAILLRNHPEALAVAAGAASGRTAVIAIGSDQGMCGQFNSEMADYVASDVGLARSSDASQEILVVGARLARELEGAGIHVEDRLPLPSSVVGITGRVEELALRIGRWREVQNIGRVALFHHRFLGGTSYEPSSFQLVPIDTDWLRKLRARPWSTRMLPSYTMDWRRLFSSLVEQYFFIWLYRAMAESAAAENAARLASMQAAEENVEERLQDLTARYHRRRQSVITEELLDVIAGFEILETADRKQRRSRSA
jgi:F-type H+-transporting ATPase subunit gamma